MSSGFSSFLTRGEDGIWRRRTSPKRSSRSRSGASGPYGATTTDYDVKTFSQGHYNFAGPRPPDGNHPSPPAGPRPPTADRPASGIRTAVGYHSRRLVEAGAGSSPYRQSYAESAAAAAAAKVYSQYMPRGSYTSPYGARAQSHAHTADGARPGSSAGPHSAARTAGTEGRPMTSTSGPTHGHGAAYAAAGIQFRGGSGPTSPFRAARYGGPPPGAVTGSNAPTFSFEGGSVKMGFTPAPPGQRPASQQQKGYQARRQIYSSPGSGSSPSSPSQPPTQPQRHEPAAEPPSPAPKPTTGWAELVAPRPPDGTTEPASTEHALRHTSLTPAKIVADLSHIQKVREGTTRPGQQQGSIAASSAEAAASSPAGQQPRQPASPPPASPYARPRGVSSPAAAATAAAATGAYGRATTVSADGYRQTQNQQPQPQQRVGTAPSGGGSDAAGSNTMGMIPGYTVSTLLGEGGFCQVRLGIHHLSGRKVAIKMIEKHKLTDSNDRRRVAREIKVLKRMGQGNVIKLFEVIDSPAHIYIVMEHAASGSLLDYVRNRKRLSEADACWFFKQMLHGMQFCHDNQVVHRDIKLENILLDHNNQLKLIDFGLSTFLQSGKLLRVHCGSPSYAAPEIVGRKLYKGPPVDVWSSGVVLFGMIAGYLPFHAGSNKQELCQKIMRGVFKSPDSMSMECRDLIGRMLTVDPERRITIPEIFQHPWLVNGPEYELSHSSVYNIHRDPYTGAVQVDDSILKEMETSGFDARKTLECLMRNDCNYITATYFLLAEARAMAPRGGAAGSREAAGKAGQERLRRDHRDDSAIAMY